MLSHILSDHKITYTKENFNNQIGVPLTLLSATNDDDYVIVEAGTNSPGEIESLVKLIKPDIAAVTNVGYAHLESFKTLDKIAKEKYSIFNYLKKNGLAIINAEDKYIGIIKKRKKLFFGYKNHIGFFSKFSKVLKNLFYKTNFLIIEKINNNIFIINYKKEEVCIKLNLKGDHNFLNVSCAASIAISLGIKINIIKQKIETFEAVKSRLKLHKIDNNIIIIDDCYNANPNSFFAALDYLSGLDGLKIVLMGDMAELGKDSVYFHVKVGEYAKKLGIHKFLSIGENSKFASLVFGNQGYHFDDEENLKFFLTNNIKSSTFLLIKGSRSAKLEKFVEFLKTWSYS